MTAPDPIIVSALLDPDSFAWLDGLRRAHFPAERNVLDAHLTLFHALPPSLEPELRRRLSSLTRGRPLAAEASVNFHRNGTPVLRRKGGLTQFW